MSDPAERLRANINDQPLIRSSRKWWIEDLDAALAAAFADGKTSGESEGRRATVEPFLLALEGIIEAWDQRQVKPEWMDDVHRAVNLGRTVISDAQAER